MVPVEIVWQMHETADRPRPVFVSHTKKLYRVFASRCLRIASCTEGFA